MAAMAAPAMAQVNWEAVFDGQHGPGACPGTYTEFFSNYINITSVKEDHVVFQMPELSLATLRSLTGRMMANSIAVTNAARENGSAVKATLSRGAATQGSPIASASQTMSGLKSNTRHTLIAYRGNSITNVIARACFKTGYAAADMSHVENLGTGTLGATGCFAIGGERLGGGDPAIRACFCGARNRLGQWARTGTVEPGTNLTDDSTYKWLLTSAERTRRGCTSN